MQETHASIDLSSTWFARGKVSRDAEGKTFMSVNAIPLSEAHGILTGPKTLRIVTRPLMSDEVSQRFKRVELEFGVPVAFDGCTELYCWGESEDSARHRLYIRLRSQ